MHTSSQILFQILNNRFRSVAEQMSRTMVRASYSTIVKEMEDCSAALFDRQGRLIAEGANVPIHLNALGPCLETVLGQYFPPDTLAPGDLIVTNDPFAGGRSWGPHHTSDIVAILPVFHHDRRIGYAVTMLHHRDVGAAWSSSISWTVEVWQEGLRIPPIKLYEGDKLVTAAWEMILNNTRVPTDMAGDLMAQVSACKVGADGLRATAAKYGIELMEQVIDELLDYSERRTRNAIAAIPDGSYDHEEWVLDDGSHGGPYRLKVRVTVQGSDLVFDYAGTDPQIKGPINAPYSATYSATLYTVRAITDPTIPTNQGGARPIRVIAPEGSLVNCRLPAGCFQRMIVCHSIVDLLMGALAPAIPERVMADSCGNIYDRCSAINLTTHPRGGEVDHRQIWGEVVAGGLGARARKDGLSVMSCHVTNCPNPSLEAQEIEAPVRFLQKQFRPDSAGAGRFPGGYGQVRSWQTLGLDARWAHSSQKTRRPPQGLVGGKPGAPGKWILNQGLPDEEVVPYAVDDIRFLAEGTTVTHLTAAGGGYGNPLTRPPEAVARDVVRELCSIEAARRDYGVVIDPLTFTVDEAATQAERARQARNAAPRGADNE